MDHMKDGCIVANMGHSVHEIDTPSLKDLKKEKIRPHVSHIIWPDERRIVLLAEVCCGRCESCLYMYRLIFPHTNLTCLPVSSLKYASD